MVGVAAVLAVVLTALAVVVGVRSADAPAPTLAEQCAGFAAISRDRAAHDSGSPGAARVVVIGDSLSVGYGLADAAGSWPSRLPGRVHVAGFPGSGFAAHDSACGPEVSYAARARAAVAGPAPRTVVVQGGTNDWHASDAAVVSGLTVLLRHLRGLPVLVVGPPDAPARSTEADHVSAVLARVCAARHVAYLAMVRRRFTYLDDGVHLTQAAHEAFGDAVAARLRRVEAAAGR